MKFSLLRHHGVLGLNARNLLYIKPWNPRKAVAFADDKLKTKSFLGSRGVPVAKMYARIDNRKQLRAFDFAALPEDFVLKPNYGFGGEGILIIRGRSPAGDYLEQGRVPITQRELQAHIEDILEGKFSVNGRRDTAFFEKVLIPDPVFAPLHPQGLPDIRIVVFNLVPVMAMLRVPTAESHGKANVHQGGLGIGVDMAKGVTTHAAQYHRMIKTLPHGGSPSGFMIPQWEEMLLIASRIQYLTNIGYLAVDLTLDAEQGPVLLEVNARAGLMVQVANLAPLRARLERVEGLTVSSPEKGVRIAQELFGQKVDRQRAEGDDRPVLGLRETITFSGTGKNVEAPCIIDPSQEETTVTTTLLQDLLRADAAVRTDGDSDIYRVKGALGGLKFQTVVHIGGIDVPTARVVVGRRDLAGYIIDPTKTAESGMVRPKLTEDLRAVDSFLAQLDREFLPLKYLKPVNLEEEHTRAGNDTAYNPIFLYAPLPENLWELEKRLRELRLDDSVPGVLLKEKARELMLRIGMLRARGHSEAFTRCSAALFGMPSAVLTGAASAELSSHTTGAVPETAALSAADAAKAFEEAFKRYGLLDWQVVVRNALVADCAVGHRRVYLREGATFSGEHLAALIAHEVDTHILTAENGMHQPFELFRRGFAGYLDTQEGLAIWNQNRVLPEHHDKRLGPARSVLAVRFALEHSFAETRQYLESLGYSKEKAFTKTIDVKRGLSDTEEPGAFTKGLVYLRGARAIEDFVRNGGDLKRLYIGKVALEDLEQIEQIPGVRAPVLLPEYLRVTE